MSSMGMDKNGTQTIATGSFVKLLSWVARSGYPSTVITNDTLVMNTTGTGTFRYNVTFQTNSGQTMRLVKNGTTVIGSASATGTIVTTATQSIVPGDTFELQASTSFGGAFAIVNGGATQTFLEYNQLTSTQNLDGTRGVTWGIAGTLALQQVIAGGRTINWGTSGSLAVQMRLDGARSVNWGIAGNIYKGAFYNLAGTRTINWGISGALTKIPKPTPLPSVFDVQDVAMSVHTVDGRMIGDFPCNVVNSWSWSRETNEVSTGAYEIATQGAADLVEELLPWVHWTTIWHDGEAVWTGPIQTVKINSSTTQVSARDTSTFMWRTRVPVTRTWVDTHTEDIARDLWKAMLALHRIKTSPLVLAEVVQKSFTITAKAEQRMLNQLMDDLVKVGLHWTIVAGRPVLGVFPRDPVLALEQCDFMVELERRRDGTQTFNDVRVQGQNWAQNAPAELAGLRLQTLVSMDDMFGASNIQRATLQYAQDSARIRDELVVPAQASLHHQAPVTLADLVPGKVWTVHTDTISQLMRLDQVNVSGTQSGIDVQVGLVALENKDEIATLVGGGGSAG